MSHQVGNQKEGAEEEASRFGNAFVIVEMAIQKPTRPLWQVFGPLMYPFSRDLK